MPRQLKILSAGWKVGVDQPLSVIIKVVSDDLKNRPVHDIPLAREDALRLAEQLVASVRAVERLERESLERREQRKAAS